MKLEGEGKLLRIFLGESDRVNGRMMYEAIVRAARESGIAGATVLRGVEGFGARSRIPPASTFGCEHSTESKVVLPVPAGPISTESRASASSVSAAVFSARLRMLSSK